MELQPVLAGGAAVSFGERPAECTVGVKAGEGGYFFDWCFCLLQEPFGECQTMLVDVVEKRRVQYAVQIFGDLCAVCAEGLCQVYDGESRIQKQSFFHDDLVQLLFGQIFTVSVLGQRDISNQGGVHQRTDDFFLSVDKETDQRPVDADEQIVKSVVELGVV